MLLQWLIWELSLESISVIYMGAHFDVLPGGGGGYLILYIRTEPKSIQQRFLNSRLNHNIHDLVHLPPSRKVLKCILAFYSIICKNKIFDQLYDEKQAQSLSMIFDTLPPPWALQVRKRLIHPPSNPIRYIE